MGVYLKISAVQWTLGYPNTYVHSTFLGYPDKADN